MAIEIAKIDGPKILSIKERSEGHFFDFKSKLIKPASLSKTIAAFANADGGEMYIGIEDPKDGWNWDGFDTPEDANGHIQAFEELFPLGHGFRYEFIEADDENGLILRVEVEKSSKIHHATNGNIYVRRGAQNIPYHTPEQVKRLELNKGIHSFEDEKVNTDASEITNSLTTLEFMLSVIPDGEPNS